MGVSRRVYIAPRVEQEPGRSSELWDLGVREVRTWASRGVGGASLTFDDSPQGWRQGRAFGHLFRR